MLIFVTTLAILIYMVVTFCCTKKSSKGNNSAVKSSDDLDQTDSKEVKVAGAASTPDQGSLMGNLGMM